MAQEAIAFAAPRAEEMTRVAAGLGGAGIAGVVGGVVVRMAPQLGAAGPILTWGTLLGMPLVGIGGALFTRGMLGDVFQGVAAGGVYGLAYSLPALLIPAVAGRRNLGQGDRDVKLLGAGAAQRAQEAAARALGVKSSLEF
ncbi:hypothetical protein ES707_00206 [subsurface metagenome]